MKCVTLELDGSKKSIKDPTINKNLGYGMYEMGEVVKGSVKIRLEPRMKLEFFKVQLTISEKVNVLAQWVNDGSAGTSPSVSLEKTHWTSGPVVLFEDLSSSSGSAALSSSHPAPSVSSLSSSLSSSSLSSSSSSSSSLSSSGGTEKKFTFELQLPDSDKIPPTFNRDLGQQNGIALPQGGVTCVLELKGGMVEIEETEHEGEGKKTKRKFEMIGGNVALVVDAKRSESRKALDHALRIGPQRFQSSKEFSLRSGALSATLEVESTAFVVGLTPVIIDLGIVNQSKKKIRSLELSLVALPKFFREGYQFGMVPDLADHPGLTVLDMFHIDTHEDLPNAKKGSGEWMHRVALDPFPLHLRPSFTSHHISVNYTLRLTLHFLLSRKLVLDAPIHLISSFVVP